MAERLLQAVRRSDVVARLHGDEFVIATGDHLTTEAVAGVAERVLDALRSPVVVQEHRLEIRASVGIAVYPAHGRDVDTLLRHADMALYVAKDSRVELAVYAPEHDAHSPKRLALKAELRQAIQRDELVLRYQPQIDIRSGVLLGAEALVRWRHPEQGMLPPRAFVPLAEQTRLIRPLSRWLVRAALRQVAAWRGACR
jgi:predicted signal transduction protein with EAL and GGDEF domain